MKWLPKTLFVRLLTMMVIVVVLSQVATWFVIQQERAQLIARQFSATKIAQIQGLRSALANVPSAQRFEAISKLGQEYGAIIVPVERRPEIGNVARGPRIMQIVEQLRKEFGQDVEIRQAGRDGVPHIFLRLTSADQAYWVGVPLERQIDSFPWRTTLFLGGLLSMLMLAAYAFARRAAQPLRELASAAISIGQGQTPPRITERGPAEITAVARGFNQMRDDLAKLEEERAVMLAGVSHDVRTPLTRLRLELEMSALDEKIKAAMRLDLDEIERTVGQFMEFARTTNEIQKTPMHIDDWLPERIAREQARHGDAVRYSPSPTPQLFGHAPSLDRAVTNLVDNAFRYGSETVDVSVHAEGAAIVAILVEDRGPGIAPEDAQRLLRPFTRGNSARSNTGGAGLGLAIVARIAQWHGGELVLHPRAGGGTTARLTLRAATQ